MKNTRMLILAALLGVGLLSAADGPQFNAKGELLFPAGYREWVFLSSGLGMTYGPLAAKSGEEPRFDNVFASPSAYKAFMQTGHWPDQTILLIEVRAASSKGSINQGGHFQADLEGIEVEVKDAKRFSTGWAFFSLNKGAASGKQRPATDSCYSCHAAHGAVDNTFVQFYPTLLSVAKEKGTLK